MGVECNSVKCRRSERTGLFSTTLDGLGSTGRAYRKKEHASDKVCWSQQWRLGDFHAGNWAFLLRLMFLLDSSSTCTICILKKKEPTMVIASSDVVRKAQMTLEDQEFGEGSLGHRLHKYLALLSPCSLRIQDHALPGCKDFAKSN
jgi:hypothetical protein